MKKIYWVFITIVLIISLVIIFYKTDYLQNLGLKIPRNFEDCKNFGGQVTSDAKPGVAFGSATYFCQYKNWKFQTIKIF